jgi:uncharacterized HAD superfamily protein
MAIFSVDVDGTLAGYNKAIADLAVKLGVTVDPEPLDAWIHEHTEEFWGNLADLNSVSDKMELNAAIHAGHTIHYISRRPSSIHALTEQWLEKHDYPSPTSLHLSSDKGHIADLLKVEFHVDDLVPDATRVALATEAKVFLIKRAWNQHVLFRDEGEQRGSSSYSFDLATVDSIAEYVTFVREEE